MIENLLIEIRDIVKQQNTIPQLWSIDDLAHYFNFSKSKVKTLTNRPDFPKPIKLSATQPRWKPDEVMTWSEQQRN